jgi:predicted ester cyclase
MAVSSNQENKELVWAFWQNLNNTKPDSLADLVTVYSHQDIAWYGPHPINDLQGVDALISRFWRPLLRSLPDVQRRSDILMGGRFAEKDWVCATGYFTGTFAEDWLDIPATGREANIRFGEFCAVKDGKIIETYIILDVLDVMRQAGYQVLPPSFGENGLVPGPDTQDGVLLTEQDSLESRKSLELVEAMLRGLMEYDQSSLSTMGQARFWHPDMVWYGPSGIGTTRGLKGFEDDHQIPFLSAFPDRKGGNHKARFADGNYVASTGWPSLHATHRGEYLGCAATGKRVGMRVMDLWRREGDLLVENWVFIDMIDLFLQLGVDLFSRLQDQIELKDG